MSKPFTPQERFAELVKRVFLKVGFELRVDQWDWETEQMIPPPQAAVDLVLEGGFAVTTVLETRAYRSLTPSQDDLERARAVLEIARSRLRAHYALLVINLRRESLPIDLKVPDGVFLIGIDDLVSAVSRDPELMKDIGDVVRELHSALSEFDSAIDLLPADKPIRLEQFKEFPDIDPVWAEVEVTKPKGAVLAEELLTIPPGGGSSAEFGVQEAHWKRFELKVQEALEYVFDGGLDDWRRQAVTGGEQDRADIIAKVIGTDAFSVALVTHFRSRYVLFEIKNYTEEVGTDAIHITEKYLFPTALRATVIFVSPKGLSTQARKETRGALRDASKLMLDLPLNTLVKMLHAKDAGTPGGELMETILDSFLLSLGR